MKKQSLSIEAASQVVSELGYTFGNIQCAPDDPQCLARETRSGKRQLYWLRFAGGLCNPESVDFNMSHLGKVSKATGEAHYSWRMVSKEAYDCYRVYLVTRNEGDIRRAERALR